MIDFDKTIADIEGWIRTFERSLAETRGEGVVSPMSMRAVAIENYTDLIEDLRADVRKWEAKKAALAPADPVPVESH